MEFRRNDMLYLGPIAKGSEREKKTRPTHAFTRLVRPSFSAFFLTLPSLDRVAWYMIRAAAAVGCKLL